MKQTTDKISEMYNDVAREYAKKFFQEHEKKPKDQEILQKFAKAVAGRKPVWDLGCGPGQTAHYLHKLGVAISGLDASREMIQQAKTIHPGIHFRKGNMLDLEFEDASIAGIVAFYAIVHFSYEQVEKAFREIFRVLQPGSVFLITYHIGEGEFHINEFLGKEVDIDVMFFKTDFISSCIREIGFERIEIIERDPYPEVEYPSRRAYIFARKPI